MRSALFQMLVPIFFLFSATHAQAVTIYTDFDSWNAALSGPSFTETFESLDFENPSDPSANFVDLGFFETYGGVITVAQLPYTSGDYLGVSRDFTGDASFLDSNYIAIRAPRHLSIELPEGTTAFGFNFADIQGNVVEFAIQPIDDVPGTIRLNSFTDGYGFFGYIADEPIDRVLVLNTSFSTAGTYAVIDNFSLGPLPPPIPEPETYAMMLTGLGLIGWMGRRRAYAGTKAPLVNC